MTRYIFALVGVAIVLLSVRDAGAQFGRGHTRRDDDRRDHGRRDDGHREGASRDGRSSAAERKLYRFKTAQERLPEGIPDWFVERDANGDGQVFMAEFATRWTDNLVREYLEFDANADGVITPKECLAAREAGAIFSGDTLSTKPVSSATPSTAGPSATGAGRQSSEPRSSPASTSGDVAATTPSNPADSEKKTAETSESQGGPATSAGAVAAAAPGAAVDSEKKSTETSEEQEAVASSDGVEIPEAYMKYAISYIRMHDTDGNGMLTTDEWEKMRKSPQSADRNGDGRVTPQEYALSLVKR